MSKTGFLTGAAVAALLTLPANAEGIDVPAGGLKDALSAYTAQTGVHVLYAESLIKGAQTKGFRGNLPADQALTRILAGTGLMPHQDSGVVEIIRGNQSSQATQLEDTSVQLAQLSPRNVSVETVTVTSSKLGGADVQSVPIAITAMSQEQLTATQTAGGPDLVKQVPNLTFSKTNFSGYNIQIRGIGTQAISVSTDPAVAVAFNDIPFIRNHFFEQEFYDVSSVEVLRGPQGTLYGRNATAGVVNLISAKPSDQFEAMASADIGNYQNRRFEGMLNVPIIGDKLDVRVAGEWTKRKGYSFNDQTQESVDGRDLWSTRATIQFRPFEGLTANLIWEHFQEKDDRLRSGKQLCTRDNGPDFVDGPTGPQPAAGTIKGTWLTQGCKPGSLYGPSAFETPNAAAFPPIGALSGAFIVFIPYFVDPYGGVVQSQSLRDINSLLDPKYTAKNDTFEFSVDYDINSELTLTSQTGYNKDSLYSTEDYNRFNTAPGIFSGDRTRVTGLVGDDGEFCDPQLGCSSRLVGEDVSQEHAYQFSQELRLASNFGGPLNFAVGGNFLHYQTVEDYYIFLNAITLLNEYYNADGAGGLTNPNAAHNPFDPAIANSCGPQPADPNNTGGLYLGLGCSYIDPHPLDQIDGEGHNYFRSQNPYRLNSWAGFGEVYYQVTPEVKLTGGLRWTDDMKYFVEIPSWVSVVGKGYPEGSVINQQWKKLTGRFVANWTPKLDFTDQSLFYGSYSRGYKGGGANPPGPIPTTSGGMRIDSPSNATHPLTFKPEYVDAFELGTKNTLLDGSLTFNGDVFYYKYQNYQISQIVDRTSVNLNFDADVKGAEMEATWEPTPGLRFNLSAGYESAKLANGSSAIDLMDRTAGHTEWMVVKPFVTQTSNCILPTYVVNEILAQGAPTFACISAYGTVFGGHPVDPVTLQPYQPDPPAFPGYPGFDSATAPNSGAGFTKDLSGNSLPNTPPFTLSAGAQYSMPLTTDWVGTVRADGYWQGNSFARVFNDKPYDQIHAYTNLNLSLVFTNQNGWQAMAYMKNVFDTTAITGAFLNSDDTGLTTNVFVTDPRLFGIRITKNW
jgi:outer membrane receptor protein involved in Fe transport